MSSGHRLTAVLARRATACVCIGGAWIVLLDLVQPGEAQPLVGAWQFGHGEAAAQAAHSAANRLRQGCTVHIYCNRIGLGHTRAGQRCVELHGITAVQQILPAPQAEPQPVMGNTPPTAAQAA